jgi:hypothetical protein
MSDLHVFGACIVADALDPEMLGEVQTALYRAAESDRKYGRVRNYQYGADDHINQRVWNLPSRDPVFCALAEHPIAMHFVREILGWPAQHVRQHHVCRRCQHDAARRPGLHAAALGPPARDKRRMVC